MRRWASKGTLVRTGRETVYGGGGAGAGKVPQAKTQKQGKKKKKPGKNLRQNNRAARSKKNSVLGKTRGAMDTNGIKGTSLTTKNKDKKTGKNVSKPAWVTESSL